MRHNAFGTPVPAISHCAKHAPVAAAQYGVLPVIIFQEMGKRYAALIGVCNGFYMLPQVMHAANLVVYTTATYLQIHDGVCCGDRVYIRNQTTAAYLFMV